VRPRAEAVEAGALLPRLRGAAEGRVCGDSFPISRELTVVVGRLLVSGEKRTEAAEEVLVLFPGLIDGSLSGSKASTSKSSSPMSSFQCDEAAAAEAAVVVAGPRAPNPRDDVVTGAVVPR
jgi:hypothetical protein